MLVSYLALNIMGLASLVFADSSVGRTCGLKIASCPEDMTCIPSDPTCVDINKCLGTCQLTNKYPICGGRLANPRSCGDDAICIDDPRIPTTCGMACDGTGVCIPKKFAYCAGLKGFKCPQGLFCYDLPNDGCDPENGGRDCIGMCL